MHMAKTPQAHGILNVMRSNDKGLVNKHCVSEGHGESGGGQGNLAEIEQLFYGLNPLQEIIIFLLKKVY